jgi:hypothetical protein
MDVPWHVCVCAGVQVRMRRAEPRAVLAGGGADGARPRQDVADGAGVRKVQRRVLLLPPGDAVRGWVPGPRPRRGGERTPDADADLQGVNFLLRGADGHQGGRARRVHPGLHLLHRRRGPGFRHGRTVITRLLPRAYAPLRSAFVKAMADLGYKKATTTSFLDTCYRLTGVQGKALPAVSLAFHGGVRLDWQKPSRWCMS